MADTLTDLSNNPFAYSPAECLARIQIVHFAIVDKHTGRVVATAKTRRGATRAADRRDNEYGAYRYGVRAVYANGDETSCF